MTQFNVSNLLVDLTQFDLSNKQEISRGGFGQVYRASIPLFSHDQPIECALHTSSNVEHTSGLRTFLFQIECQAFLKHPAILPIIGYTLPICGQKEFILISPFMKNGTVEEVYIRHPTSNVFDTKQAIAIFGIAAGLAFCHQNNILHRDIKPSNILLDDNNCPKITDFALAKVFVEGTEGEVDMETMVGTPIYMAPEMISDDRAPISNKSDVYSYAITIFEIFSRCHAYKGFTGTPMKLMKDIVKGGLRPTIDDNIIPKAFVDLLNRCWSADPYDRPTFREIVKDYMDRRDVYFNQPDIDQNELNNYITEVTKDLKF